MVRHRKLILILCLLLCVPSVIGMMSTRINYDMLTHLPDGLDTVTGQDILMDDYGKGAFSIIVIEDQTPEKVEQFRSDISQVDHVTCHRLQQRVLSADVPLEILPKSTMRPSTKVDDTLMAVFLIRPRRQMRPLRPSERSGRLPERPATLRACRPW